MNAETRGLIEKYIDEVYERGNILDSVDWILQADEEVERLELESVASNAIKEDLALGYVLSDIVSFGLTIMQHNVSFIQFVRGTRIVEVSPEDFNDLKNLVKLRIKPFREKIRKELAQKTL